MIKLYKQCYSLVFTLGFTMSLFGCAVTLNPDADGMKAETVPTEQEARASKYYHQIIVGKITIEETGHAPYRNVVVEENELRQAIEDSLTTSHLIAEDDPGAAKYILNATVIKTPLGAEAGMLTITVYIAYELIDRQSGAVLFEETIAGWERAKLGPFLKFHEHAFRINIENLILRLTEKSNTYKRQD